MKLVDPHTGIEVIERAECLELLARDVVGRLAVVDHGAPVIFPVNYAMDGSDIVFRTDPGTKLDAQGRAPACFEIDSFDPSTRTGWSVVASGHLDEVTAHDRRRLDRLQALPIDPWAGGSKLHWMRLVPDRITGRHVRP
jgi:uncharacterized protein